jgi:hypothetical protein
MSVLSLLKAMLLQAINFIRNTIIFLVEKYETSILLPLNESWLAFLSFFLFELTLVESLTL